MVTDKKTGQQLPLRDIKVSEDSGAVLSLSCGYNDSLSWINHSVGEIPIEQLPFTIEVVDFL